MFDPYNIFIASLFAIGTIAGLNLWENFIQMFVLYFLIFTISLTATHNMFYNSKFKLFTIPQFSKWVSKYYFVESSEGDLIPLLKFYYDINCKPLLIKNKTSDEFQYLSYQEIYDKLTFNGNEFFIFRSYEIPLKSTNDLPILMWDISQVEAMAFQFPPLKTVSPHIYRNTGQIPGYQ
jgi:hypothetical protein